MKKKSGCMIDGKWITFYDIGKNAYFSRQAYSESQSRTWQQGWRAGRDSDMKLLTQCHSQATKDSITHRMCEAMGITQLSMAA